jgi:hypothetical protein
MTGCVDVTPRACQTSILTMTRGGVREGAGRKSAFPGKVLGKNFGMDFTPAGRKALDRLQAATGLSRNDILAHLALRHAHDLVFDGKAQSVLSIRLPADAGDALRAAHMRTGKGYSDLGEALVTRYGPEAVFPVVEGKTRARKRPRRPGRRA